MHQIYTKKKKHLVKALNFLISTNRDETFIYSRCIKLSQSEYDM